MPTEREKRYVLIKKVVADAEGSLLVAAPILNTTAKALSETLNSALREWWTSFKHRKKVERRRARRRRWYANKERRGLEAAGLDPNSYQAHKSS